MTILILTDELICNLEQFSHISISHNPDGDTVTVDGHGCGGPVTLLVVEKHMVAKEGRRLGLASCYLKRLVEAMENDHVKSLTFEKVFASASSDYGEIIARRVREELESRNGVA